MHTYIDVILITSNIIKTSVISEDNVITVCRLHILIPKHRKLQKCLFNRKLLFWVHELWLYSTKGPAEDSNPLLLDRAVRWVTGEPALLSTCPLVRPIKITTKIINIWKYIIIKLTILQEILNNIFEISHWQLFLAYWWNLFASVCYWTQWNLQSTRADWGT